MPMDPRLNCAAEICCPPPKPTQGGAAVASNEPALDAAAGILRDAGVRPSHAREVAQSLRRMGVCLLPCRLADVIREIAFGDDAQHKEHSALHDPNDGAAPVA